MKEMIRELRRDKERREERSKKDMGQLSKEVGSYFKAKAKDRKYFYGR